MRSRDHADGTVHRPHPRQHGAVVEAHDELHRHRHPAPHTLHQAHQVDALVAHRHAVDDPDRALGGVPLGLEHEGAVAVGPAGAAAAGGGPDLPVAVGLVTEERGEARAGIEPGDAEPVDRAVVGDQRGGLGVADERVLLDARRHASAVTLGGSPR